MNEVEWDIALDRVMFEFDDADAGTDTNVSLDACDIGDGVSELF